MEIAISIVLAMLGVVVVAIVLYLILEFWEQFVGLVVAILFTAVVCIGIYQLAIKIVMPLLGWEHHV